MKRLRTINKFNQKHSSLRRFLRLISYGCYHRMLFRGHGINERTYDDELRQMRFFIPESSIIETHQAGHTHISFRGSPYTQTYNFLANSFYLKTLLPDACLHSLMILQITAKHGSPLPLADIVDTIEDALMEHTPELIMGEADLVQLLRRRANELAEVGLLQVCGKGRRLAYRLAPQPLLKLSSQEASKLLCAIGFYKNVSLVSVPGYFLARNISEAFPSISPPTDIFQFRNNNFTRILDDELLVTIIQAIKSQKALVARRKDKPTITVLPRAIYTDYIYNRQYIIGRKLLSPGKAEPVFLRIDLLTDIAFAEVPLPPSAATATRLQEIHLRVTFDNAREKSEREDLLISRGAKITSAEPHVFLCTIPAVDPLRLYPWLWSLQPWAEILPGKDGLRRRMEKDLRNMLTDYGLD